MEENNEKELFNAHYKEYYKSYPNKQPYNMQQLNKIMEEITTAKNKDCITKTRREYYLLKTYDIVTMNEKSSLIKKVRNPGDPIIYLVPEEELYNRLLDIHINCRHGSRDKMINIIHQTCFIPRPCVEMFLKSCKTCQTKKTKAVDKVVVKPRISRCFMTRGQVDLIDFQSIADGNFKWLLNYQDQATKYICLRPLRSKETVEVAQELIKIFLQFGVPSVLQSDNGREFACKIIEELKLLWPQLYIVHGRTRNPQSTDSVERVNQDVENKLWSWMRENKTTAWSTGCYFVQWQKNTSLHRAIGRSPFKAVFGSDPKLGVQSTSLPHYLIPTIATEEQLEQFNKEFNNETYQVGEINTQASAEINEDYDDLGNTENFEETDEIDYLLIETVNGESIGEEIQVNNTTQNDIKIEFVDMQSRSCELNSANISCIECRELICDTAAIVCETCKCNLHFTCAEGRKNCNICNTKEKIKTEPEDELLEGQKRQAEEMMAVSKKQLPNVDIGDCVLINIEKMDHSPGDPPNLTAVITDVKNGVYQVGTTGGIIKSWFNRHDLQKLTSNFITLNQVNSKQFMTLTEAVSLESLLKGQGNIKCLCQPSKVQCKTNRCQCFKSKLQCNSRCHKSGFCFNK